MKTDEVKERDMSLVSALLHHFSPTGYKKFLMADLEGNERWTQKEAVAEVARMCDEREVITLPSGRKRDLRLLWKDNTMKKRGCTYLLTPLGEFMRDYADGQFELPKQYTYEE